MSQQNSTVAEFDNLCRNQGFRKKGGTWRRQNGDLLELLQLQKSTYGPQYYLNIGIGLLAVHPALEPKIHQTHIQSRADALFPDWRDRLRLALDLESDAPESHRLAELNRFMTSALLPLLDNVQSIPDLAREGDGRLLERTMIRPEAREAMGAIG